MCIEIIFSSEVHNRKASEINYYSSYLTDPSVCGHLNAALSQVAVY